MWKPPDNFFEVKPISSGWTVPPVQPFKYEQDTAKKQAYGIELAKINAADLNAYLKAACEVFPDDVPSSVWASQHWVTDPVVAGARDAYSKTLKEVEPLLDKEGLAAKLLACAEEKVVRNGQAYYTNEAKDRLGFLKLYAEVMGFAGKSLIDASTTFTNNEMKVVLVKPEAKQEIKAPKPIIELEHEELNVTPLRIKAV